MNCHAEDFEKLDLLRKRKRPKVSIFGPTLNQSWTKLLPPPKKNLPLEDMADIKKSKYYLRKNFSYREIQIYQSQSPISSPLSIKMGLLFALSRPKNKVGSKVKGSKSKSNTTYNSAINPILLNTEKAWSHHFPILLLLTPTAIFENSYCSFSSLAALLRITPTFAEKMSLISYTKI